MTMLCYQRVSHGKPVDFAGDLRLQHIPRAPWPRSMEIRPRKARRHAGGERKAPEAPLWEGLQCRL